MAGHTEFSTLVNSQALACIIEYNEHDVSVLNVENNLYYV